MLHSGAWPGVASDSAARQGGSLPGAGRPARQDCFLGGAAQQLGDSLPMQLGSLRAMLQMGYLQAVLYQVGCVSKLYKEWRSCRVLHTIWNCILCWVASVFVCYKRKQLGALRAMLQMRHL